MNCAAIPETLMESELFGHEKGAFSGAERLRKGAFEEADQGTLFLDEIGEMPLDLQAKLLRALDSAEVKRVGASRPIHVSVRVLSATHRDLPAQVRAGKFREDLFYRLSVIPLSVPPLRARQGDVRALAQRFLDATAPRGLQLRWSEDALRRLESYDWPGNVRQLKNVVQRALLFRGEGTVLPASAVTFEDLRPAAVPGGDDTTLYLPGLTLEEIEREAIRLSLRRNRGKRAAVVKELADREEHGDEAHRPVEAAGRGAGERRAARGRRLGGRRSVPEVLRPDRLHQLHLLERLGREVEGVGAARPQEPGDGDVDLGLRRQHGANQLPPREGHLVERLDVERVAGRDEQRAAPRLGEELHRQHPARLDDPPRARGGGHRGRSAGRRGR